MLAVAAALGLALAAPTLPLLALSRYAVTPRPPGQHAERAALPSTHAP